MTNASVRFGTTLRNLRQSAELSVEDLAEERGIPEADLVAFERGERLPTAHQIEQLAEAIGVRVSKLVGMRGTDRPLVYSEKMPFFFSGTGGDEESARLEKERLKTAQVPYWPVELPDDLTAPELEALMLPALRGILDGMYLVSSIVRAAPESVAPEMFRHAVLLMLFEMVPDVAQLAHAMENNPNAGPLAFVLSEKRNGRWDPSRVRFSVKLNGGEDESKS